MPEYINYTLYVCQIEPKPNGVTSQTFNDQGEQDNTEEEGFYDFTLYVLADDSTGVDLNFDLEVLTDGGGIDLCDYSTSISWGVINDTTCTLDVAWTNPNVYCALKTVELHSTKSQGLLPFICQIGVNEGADPVGSVYPDDDIRNADCMSCGIGGDSETCDITDPVPGEQLQVYGYFTDPNCGGIGTPVLLDTSWFQTDGFTGGSLLSVVDSGVGFSYILASIMGENEQIKGVDMSEPSGGGTFIPVIKVGCEHAGGGFNNADVCTNINKLKYINWNWSML